ncbi:hypothetical protein KZZ52_21850 [Dactylosporangium sp. AC04546]|uniref:hypothetical protein n=1 Tax=Dactylosporangium sp. AC04546 TaxID=2862460 RepID=UPI001EDCC8BC|nr:hypothetical protein [Dactylosporangium sp. AC04546]WVK87926.1 hypothetical protein KZZ52_21850 [Dactylosporangium sp. AC04546]
MDRQRLLSGVAARLRELGIPAEFGLLVPYQDFYGSSPDGLTGLVVPQPDGPGRMQVTVVAARRTVPPGEGGLSADGRMWVRDVDLDYDLAGDALAFEFTTLDEGGAGPVWAPRQLAHDEEAVVDAIRLWDGFRETLRSTPPAAAPARRRAVFVKQVAARQAASAAARVRLDAAIDLDPARLCYHFPRDRHGRYVKNAVVALHDVEGGPFSKRGPWVAARADGDELVVAVEGLIGANQDHRWDRLPWLFRRLEAAPGERWQVADAADARPVVELLERHEVAEALTLCGVDVDGDLAALLDGHPIDYRHARYTDTWVRTLYEQLRDCAPWRLATAHRLAAAGKPIPLFGLKGMNHQVKPMVALDAPDGVCRLTMHWTGSNARLTRALWEVPADLRAALL